MLSKILILYVQSTISVKLNWRYMYCMQKDFCWWIELGYHTRYVYFHSTVHLIELTK